jgi:hypothetical protein
VVNIINHDERELRSFVVTSFAFVTSRRVCPCQLHMFIAFKIKGKDIPVTGRGGP